LSRDRYLSRRDRSASESCSESGRTVRKVLRVWIVDVGVALGPVRAARNSVDASWLNLCQHG
jgi:hypothetical protein